MKRFLSNYFVNDISRLVCVMGSCVLFTLVVLLVGGTATAFGFVCGMAVMDPIMYRLLWYIPANTRVTIKQIS